MNEMRNAEPATVKAYLNQEFVYHSESKDRFIPVHTMNPVHAANAANRLIQEATGFSAGLGFPRWMTLTMIRTPLVQALLAQADKAL